MVVVTTTKLSPGRIVISQGITRTPPIQHGQRRQSSEPHAFVCKAPTHGWHLFGVFFPFFYYFLSCAAAAGSLPGIEYDYGISPKFVCTPIPPEADPSCYSPPSVPHGPASNGHANSHANGHGGSTWRGAMSDEAKATILHLRESLVRQKETILDQRETIRELTAKLTLCEGFGGGHHGVGHHDNHLENHRDNHHDSHHDSHHDDHQHHGNHHPPSSSSHHGSSHHGSSNLATITHYSHGNGGGGGHSSRSDTHHRKGSSSHSKHNSFSPEQTGKTLQTLKERLENLQDGGTKEGANKKLKSPNAFMLDFPMRTNYMYARMKRAVVNEIFAMTICLRLKSGEGPGLGTPFSYAVPGQANELVLIEWGNNPMELLINDKAVTIPITMTDGKWHHVCVTWTTRDGVWEAYQDGVKKGSGQNLSPWHPIKPGGTFILGQEQDTMGGRFDVTQSFMGELSDLQFWSRVLTPNEIYSQATCGGHLVGDVMSWSEESVELHGRLAELPFDPCH
ncbi:neuronal pentraxin-2-like [Scomber japonicus]|uniref:neuronal pentraxin-2-like n=1 Tax=Scomber japonicus TaxID=13676 RepID=UPI0023059777|nr:neuronal pentraxin-2-like [Scomber japonicus]